MRVLIFHGYLLRGTGSNVYNARLAAALVREGHEVHLLCQDRHPLVQPFVDAVGDWESGRLEVSARRDPVRATVYRPDIGSLLPVYVADRYEAMQAQTFAQCSDEQIAHYVSANVEAVREVLARVRPDVALANHLVMGPLILARALAASDVPYAVKVHGSALEYTVKPQPERFLGAAAEGLAAARTVLVGSRHTALSLWRTLDDQSLPERTRLGPPGVDVERFAPRERPQATAGLRTLAADLRRRSTRGPGPGATDDAFARDEQAAALALERLDPDRDRLVAFVGKLIVSKGVDLLVAAWPLVLERVPEARLVVVGFGAYRAALERLVALLAAGDLDGVRALADAGRALEVQTPPAGRHAQAPQGMALTHLRAFLDSRRGAAGQRYRDAARALGEHVVFTGRLEHEELAELLPACEAQVVPSTFPEAFGMVAIEAAACGALPVSAEHSGLAEVSAVLARAVPGAAAGWLSFPLEDDPVVALAERLIGWLEVEPALGDATRAALVRTVGERYSWAGVARTVLGAAAGERDAGEPIAPP